MLTGRALRNFLKHAAMNFAGCLFYPPSAKTLGERLSRRGTDTPEVVAQRMSEAASEISHWPEYDYIIINDNLDVAQAQINAILIAERAKRQRMLFLQGFVEDMLKKNL